MRTHEGFMNVLDLRLEKYGSIGEIRAYVEGYEGFGKSSGEVRGCP